MKNAFIILVFLLNYVTARATHWPFPLHAHPSAPSRSLILSNRFDDAISDLLPRIESDKEDGTLWSNLTIACLKIGNARRALEACREAVRLGQSDQIPLLVFLLIESKHINEALCYTPALRQLASDGSVDALTKIESLAILASEAIAREDAKEASKVIEQMQNITNWEAVFSRASCLSLTAQAKELGLIGVENRLTEMSTGLTQGRQGAGKLQQDKWKAGQGSYAGFTKANLAGVKHSDCNNKTSIEQESEMHREMQLFADGMINEAMQLAEAVIVGRPKYAQAWRFLGSCHRALGNSEKSFQCTSNAVVLGDGLAAMNLAIIADEQRDIPLWKSLSKHMEAISTDWQYDYVDGRLEAYAMCLKLADITRDKAEVSRLFTLLPIANEMDEIASSKLLKVNEILKYCKRVADRHGLDVGDSLFARCRSRAALAAARTPVPN